MAGPAAGLAERRAYEVSLTGQPMRSATPALPSAKPLPVDVLRLEGVGKRHGGTVALAGVSLAIPGNEYVSVLGPSGSGKTVLLRVIAGFEEPDVGEVWFDGRRIDGMAPHRRRIGFVFQNFALFPHLSVWDNIAFGLVNGTAATAGIRAKVSAMLALVGLSGLENRGVHQISGGQRQRVALARTLVTEPSLVLLDEPLGALDANLRTRMRGELRTIRSRLGITFLHVTGNEIEALAMGDRMIVLDGGRVGQFDAPATVYNRPASPNVARFLNCYNLFAGSLTGDRFVAGTGEFPLPRQRSRWPQPVYAIRHDLIRIGPPEQGPATGEAGLRATFITREYSGSAVTHFFAAQDGQIVEVESHLSHRSPQELDAKRSYGLIWAAADAVVFG